MHRNNLAGCHHTDPTKCVTEDCEPVAQTTVSLGELLPPVVEVSGLAEEEDTEEGSFKEQYGQEGSKLSISSSHLWAVYVWEECEWSLLLNSFSHFLSYHVEMHHRPWEHYP